MSDTHLNQSLGMADDVDEILAKIREENLRRYGTAIREKGGYGEVLLRDRYPDRTHFIFELLQNTEDAYAIKNERERDANRFIRFDLYQDRLEVRHRGKAFDETDVWSICNLVSSKKKGTPKQIGKFGIGFKSVFAFTDTPIIHSSRWSFRIDDYVFPYPEMPCEQNPSETLIIIPFNRDDLNPQVLYLEIEKKLLSLGNQSLLFLTQLDKIDWCIHSQKELKGEYRKVVEPLGHGHRVKLDFLIENDNQLSQVVQFNYKSHVRVNHEDPAYLEPIRALDMNGKETSEYCKDSRGNEIIHNRLWRYESRDAPQPIVSELFRRANGQKVMKEVPVDGYIWHFTPDSKEIALYKDVKLHGEELIKNFSEEWLVYSRPVESDGRGAGHVSIALSLKTIAEGKYVISPIVNSELVVYFPTSQPIGLRFLVHGPFNTTPSRDIVKKDDSWNLVLVKEFGALLEDSLKWVKEDGLLCLEFLKMLPIDSNEYVVSEIRTTAIERIKNALSKDSFLPRESGGFTNVENGFIAGSNDLRELLSVNQLANLTGREGACWLDGNISRTEYHDLREFLKALDVRTYDSSDFADSYTNEFAKNQSDNWIIEFYKFLGASPSLLTSGRHNSGSFRTKPIIRLEDSSHIKPFDEGNNPLVFLPNPGAPSSIKFRTVKTNIAKDQRCESFFNSLKIRTPTKTDVIRDIINKYGVAPSKVGWDENYADVRYILDALGKDLTMSEVNDTITRIKKTSLLWARNVQNGKSCPHPANDMFIGKEFTQDGSLERLYDGCESAYFLYEGYAKEYNASDDFDLLKRIGCHTLSSLVRRRVSASGVIEIADFYGYHERAIDGFDPRCHIPHIDDVLKHMTLDKAALLWNILLKQDNVGPMIRGKIQVSTRQGFHQCTTKEELSILGKYLMENRWIPNKESVFYKGSELKVDELHPSLETNSEAAKDLIAALGITDERKVMGTKTIFDEATKRKFSPTAQKFLSKIEEINNLDEEVAEQLFQNIVVQMERLKPHSKVAPDDTIVEVIKKISEPIPSGRKDVEPSPQSYDPIEDANILNRYFEGIQDTKENLKIKHIIKAISKYTIVQGGGVVSNPREYLYEQYRGRCQICGTSVVLDEGTRPHFEVLHIVSGEGRRPGANLKCNILGLCPNCWAQMKYGTSDLSKLLEVAKQAGNNEAPIEPVPHMGHAYFVVVPIKLVGRDKKLHYTNEHIGKISIEFNSMKPGDNDDLSG